MLDMIGNSVRVERKGAILGVTCNGGHAYPGLVDAQRSSCFGSLLPRPGPRCEEPLDEHLCGSDLILQRLLPGR